MVEVALERTIGDKGNMDPETQRQHIAMESRRIMEGIVLPEMEKVPSMVSGFSAPFRDNRAGGVQSCKCTKHNVNICTYTIEFGVGNENGRIGLKSKAMFVPGMRLEHRFQETLHHDETTFDVNDACSPKVNEWIISQVNKCADAIRLRERSA